MSRRPLVAFAACWAFGTSILSIWQGKAAAAVLLGAVLLLAAYAIASPGSRRVAALCAAALLAAAGERAFTDAQAASELDRLPGAADEAQAIVRGILAEPAAVDGDVATFEFEAAAISLPPEEEGETPIREKLLIRIYLQKEEEQRVAASWKRGDEAVVRGELRLPAEAGNFGGFDYRRYLDSLGIHWTLTVEGTDGASVLPSAPPWRLLPLRWADAWREKLGSLMDRLYDGTDRGYMKGLVLGIVDDLDPEQYADFSRLGLTHVLAISGLHVGVVVFILLQAGALLRLSRERSLELAIAALPFYMLLTGASPSAVRACLMAMLALYMARRNQLKDGLHLLAAAALVMMALQPRVVENVSFQLSFAVTAGLLLFVPTMDTMLSALVPWKAPRGALAVTFTATAVSFPVSVYYFHQFHLLSIPANLILVPFISFAIMPLGMASAALAGLWFPLGRMTADVASWGNRLTELAIEWTEGAGALQTYWPQAGLPWVLAAYGLMFATFIAVHRLYTYKQEAAELRRRAAAELDALRMPERLAGPEGEETVPLVNAAVHPMASPAARDARASRIPLPLLSVLWAAWLLWGVQPSFLDRNAKVMFLDVGQGDSILVRSGTGEFGLIDTGGTVSFGKKEAWRLRRDPYEVGKKTVVPLLKQRGVRSLDWLLLSHLDQDHIGGALAVLDAVRVRRLLFNGTIKRDKTTEELFRRAESLGIPMYSLHAGMSWTWDASTSLRVLYPASGDEGSGIPILEEQNDRSVVVLLTAYGRTFLLPGDLEAKGENNLLTQSGTEEVDVLKAGHHGSKSSSTEPWLRAWAPGEVVISAGRNNLYGHPHAVVLDRLFALGIPYYRTDKAGEIQYRILPNGEMFRRTMKNPVVETAD
ncbi:ComEC/Rec2 family competence protein [Cohnella fermenti]|nr:ComEC/Rec2 family competence protein [Cohnella fermenti]